jgi:predicted nucleic acid-binding protein
MATSTNPKQYVIDSSVIISYLMVDEKIKPEHEQVITEHLHHKIVLIAPIILPFEIGNSLKSAILSKRLTSSQAIELFKQFFNLEISLMPINYHTVLSLSATHNLSFYDAAYFSLAAKLKSPLLTLDKKLLSLIKV